MWPGVLLRAITSGSKYRRARPPDAGRSRRREVSRSVGLSCADRVGPVGPERYEPNMSASGQPSTGFSGHRRRIPRYSVAIPVDITVLRSEAPATIPGRSLDLGEGGVAAVLAAELPLGEWVAVEFQLPNSVRRSRPKRWFDTTTSCVAASSF